MKIRLTVTIDVDPAEWTAEYGTNPADVRDDVKAYFTNLMGQSAGGQLAASVKVAK